MTAIEIVILVVGIFIFAGVCGYAFSQGGDDTPEVETPAEYTMEELINIKAAEEAYDKPITEIVVVEPELVPQVEEMITSKKMGTDGSVTSITTAPIIEEETPVVVNLQVEPTKPKAKKKYPRKKKPVKV